LKFNSLFSLLIPKRIPLKNVQPGYIETAILVKHSDAKQRITLPVVIFHVLQTSLPGFQKKAATLLMSEDAPIQLKQAA